MAQLPMRHARPLSGAHQAMKHTMTEREVVHALLHTMQYDGWNALPKWFRDAYEVPGGIVICPNSIYVGQQEAGFNDWLVVDKDGGIGVEPRDGQNIAMAQTPAERQEARRARLLMEGRTEVRGIFAPPALHEQIKKDAKALIAKHEKPPKK